MKQPEDIIKALEICANLQRVINAAEAASTGVNFCGHCPYGDIVDCQSAMKDDAACYLKAQIDLIERLQANQVKTDPTPWTREKILDTAKQYICGPREEAYGNPAEGFK